MAPISQPLTFSPEGHRNFTQLLKLSLRCRCVFLFGGVGWELRVHPQKSTGWHWRIFLIEFIITFFVVGGINLGEREIFELKVQEKQNMMQIFCLGKNQGVSFLTRV